MDLPPERTPVPSHTHDHEYDYPWPWQQEDVLRELLDEGKTRKEMADELDTTLSTVDYWLRRHGLTNR